MLPTEKCSNRCELEVGLSHISLLHKIALFLLHVRGMDEPQGAALSGSRREAGCLGTGVGGGEQDCPRSHEAGTRAQGEGKPPLHTATRREIPSSMKVLYPFSFHVSGDR